MSSHVAYGAYFYHKVDGDPLSTGQAGRASFNGSSITHLETNRGGLTTDPKTMWFKNAAGKMRLLIAETNYNADRTPQPSQFSIWQEYSGELIKVYPSAGTEEWGYGSDIAQKLINVYAITDSIAVGDDRYFYGIDYDHKVVFRVKDNGNDSYSFDASTKYVHTSSSAQNFGVDLVYDGASLYALFIRGADVYGGDYDNSSIVKLDTGLQVSQMRETLAKNAFCVIPHGSNLYIGAIGGEQKYGLGWNAGSAVQRIDKALAANTLKTLLRNEPQGSTSTNDEDKLDFHSLTIGKNGTVDEVFLLKGIYRADYTTFDARLCRVTLSALDGANNALISSLSPVMSSDVLFNGPTLGVIYSDNDSAAWMSRGDSLAVYKYGSLTKKITLSAEIDVSALASFPKVPTKRFSINYVSLCGQSRSGMRAAQHPAFASKSAAAYKLRLEMEKEQEK